MSDIETYRAWGGRQWPWGYEVRVDFVFTDGRVVNETLNFDIEPSDSAMNSAIADLAEKVSIRENMATAEGVE